MQTRRHVGNFDTLRITLAVLVIYSHSFALGIGNFDREPLFHATRGQLTIGNISVLAFFVISGYLITQSWTRSPDPFEYLLHRARRIYPAFIVAALFGALIVVPLAAEKASYFPVSPIDFALQTLTLQSFVYPPCFMQNAVKAINGSLWSVRYEFWCYIGILFLGMAKVFRRRWIVAGIFALSIGYLLYLTATGGAVQSNQGWIDFAPKENGWVAFQSIFGSTTIWAKVLPFFIAGSVFQLFGGPALLRRPLLFVASILLVATTFFPILYAVVLPTCGAYLLFGLAYLRILHPLNLGRFGDFSYGTYLYAYPVQQLIVKYAGGRLEPMKCFLMASVVSLIFGILSWFLVERHFLRKKTPPTALHSPPLQG